jgi:hypothetical protein
MFSIETIIGKWFLKEDGMFRPKILTTLFIVFCAFGCVNLDLANPDDESETDTDGGADTETGTGDGSDTDVDSDSDTDSDSDSATDSDSDSDSDADSDGDSDSDGDVDTECIDVVCDDPPDDECESPTSIFEYPDEGYCKDGDCYYDPVATPCNFPPVGFCTGDIAVFIYSTNGLCDHDAGACEYDGGIEECDDEISCTVDSCDEVSLCVFTPNDDACDDFNDCTDDSCDALSDCQFVNDDTNTCDDGDFCNGEESCSGGECNHTGNPCVDIDCEHGNCVDGKQECITTGCVDCDNDDDCNTGYKCSSNQCVEKCPNGYFLAATSNVCWYLGNTNQSCTAVCAGHGSYDNQTRDYAGSGGNATQCQNVLNLFSGSGSGSVEDIDCNTALGCLYDTDLNARRRCYSPTTTAGASYSYVKRPCACTE